MNKHSFNKYLVGAVLAASVVIFTYVPVAKAWICSGACDVITVGFSHDLKNVLSEWDLTKNPDVVYNAGTVTDEGNQVIPFGETIYIGGESNSGKGLVMHFNSSGRLITKTNSSKHINNAKGRFKAMAVDAQGDIYTGVSVPSGFPMVNTFSKYSGSSYSELWTRQQRATACPTINGNYVTVVHMLTDNNTLYAAGSDTSGNCGGNMVRMVATTTGLSGYGLTSDWENKYTNASESSMSPNGSVAIGPGSDGNRYLYALGRTLKGMNSYSITQYRIINGIVSSTPNNEWLSLKSSSTSVNPAQIIVNSNPGSSAYGWVFVTGSFFDGVSYRYYTEAYDTYGTRRWPKLGEESKTFELVDGRTSASVGNHNYAGGLALSPDGAELYVTGRSYPNAVGDWGRHFYTVKYNALTGERKGGAISDFGLKEQALGIAATNAGVFITGYVPYETENTEDVAATGAYTDKAIYTQSELASMTVGGKVKNVKTTQVAKPFAIQFCFDGDKTTCGTNSLASPNSNVFYSTSTMALSSNTELKVATSTLPLSADMSAKVAALAPGDHHITMCADPFNTIAEVDASGVPGSGEGNNCINSAKFTLVAPPTLNLYAEPSAVISGKKTSLKWTSQNVAQNSCTLTDGSGGTQAGLAAQNTSGLETAAITAGKNNFGLECVGTNGANVNSSVSVGILNPAVDITASAARVRSPGNSTISWTATDVTSCQVTGPGLSPNPRTELSGSQVVAGITTQSVYRITCTNDGNIYTDSVTVNVVPTYQDF